MFLAETYSPKDLTHLTRPSLRRRQFLTANHGQRFALPRRTPFSHIHTKKTRPDIRVYGQTGLVVQHSKLLETLMSGAFNIANRTCMKTMPNGGSTSFLSLTRVSKNFGGLKAVNSVDISVERGEIRGLIGPNGSGKTTIFNLITGFIHPDEGEIFFEGDKITERRPDEICRRGIARTFQLGKPFPTLTVIENILTGAYIGGRNKDLAREMAREILKFLNLEDKSNIRVSKLTVIEKKLTELGRTLATRPKLILLDEIMAGLTDVELKHVQDIIRKIREMEITVIMVEHIMNAVMSLCGKVTVLDFGQKIAEGEPKDIAKSEQVINAYLGQKWQTMQK